MFRIDEEIQQQFLLIKNLMADFYCSKYFKESSFRLQNNSRLNPDCYDARNNGFHPFNKLGLIETAFKYIDFNEITSDVPRDVSMDLIRELIIEHVLEKYPYKEKLEKQKAKEVE